MGTYFNTCLNELEEEYEQTKQTLTDMKASVFGPPALQTGLNRRPTFLLFTLVICSSFASPANRTAFSVALFEDGPFKCYGPFANEQPVMFKKVFLNLGNGYNPNNGIFIVPHSGVYSLAFTVYSDAGSPNSKLAACAKLLVNSEIIIGSTDINRHDQEDSSSNVLVLHLNRSDQVTLSLSPGCFLCDDGYHYNTFSGLPGFPMPPDWL
uniref:Cerebellin 20 n=1 Tax=Labrus bergylta TaxID=56723 RepID=A0A3Q3F8Q6_9LABR